MSTDSERLARTAYETYRRARPGSLPPWEEAPEDDQIAWKAVVLAVTGQDGATLAEGGISSQTLVIQVGDQTQVFHKEFVAGRQGSLIISDEHASGHHALFQSAHNLWYVEDLGSTNGTWLNGRRIYSSQRLKKGDKIRIGHTVINVVSV